LVLQNLIGSCFFWLGMSGCCGEPGACTSPMSWSPHIACLHRVSISRSGLPLRACRAVHGIVGQEALDSGCYRSHWLYKQENTKKEVEHLAHPNKLSLVCSEILDDCVECFLSSLVSSSRLGHSCLALCLLPNANSFVILKFFKSLFTNSSHVKVDFFLPLFPLLV
jgi:hypothetical protein